MSISSKKLIANQLNAKLGGVKTAAGKSISKMNATKHGILSKDLVLSDEKRNEFELLSLSLMKDLQPQGGLEQLLVEKIIASAWRLKRLLRLEAGQLDFLINDPIMSAFYIRDYGKKLAKSKVNGEAIQSETIDKIMRYEAFLERVQYKAIYELRSIQMARKTPLINNAPQEVLPLT